MTRNPAKRCQFTRTPVGPCPCRSNDYSVVARVTEAPSVRASAEPALGIFCSQHALFRNDLKACDEEYEYHRAHQHEWHRDVHRPAHEHQGQANIHWISRVSIYAAGHNGGCRSNIHRIDGRFGSAKRQYAKHRDENSQAGQAARYGQAQGASTLRQRRRARACPHHRTDQQGNNGWRYFVFQSVHMRMLQKGHSTSTPRKFLSHNARTFDHGLA